MRENQSPYAVFQIGLGIICILIGGSGLFISRNLLLSLEALSLGIGILLYGLANSNQDKSEKGKMFTAVGSVFYLLGAGLIFYNLFFSSK